MRQHEQQQARFPADHAASSGTVRTSQPPELPRTDRGGDRLGFGVLWLLLIPVICCTGPLLIAGLAAAGAMAWGGLGLVVAAVLAGVLLTIRLYRRSRASEKPRKPS